MEWLFENTFCSGRDVHDSDKSKVRCKSKNVPEPDFYFSAPMIIANAISKKNGGFITESAALHH